MRYHLRFTTALYPALLLAAAVVAGCGGMRSDAVPDPAEVSAAMVAEGDTVGAIHYLERTNRDHRLDLRLRLAELFRDTGTINGRLRSQMELEDALREYPDNPDVLVALGRTYCAQTFFPGAERCFQRALQIDDTRCDARFYLGCNYYDRWRRVNEHKDELSAARRYFDATLACDSMNVRAAVHMAYSLYVLGYFEELEAECAKLLLRFPRKAELHMLQGVLAFDDERYRDAAASFERGLPLFRERDRAAFYDIDRVLSYRAIDRFASAAEPDREIMTRRWWLDADLDPTTDINERVLEHTYRVFLADVHFSVAWPETRGWNTERGELLIKFGWPLGIHDTMGDRPNDGREQSWLYVIDGHIHEFLFVDERLNGNLRIPYDRDVKLSFIRHSNNRSDIVPAAMPVPGDLDVVAFKDDDLGATIYLAARVDADSLRALTSHQGVGGFYLRAALFNDEWVAEHRLADTLSAGVVPWITRWSRRHYDVIRELQVPFDYYHIAFTFEDHRSLAQAQLRGDGDTHRFLGDDLAMSDLLLQSDPPAGVAAIQRGSRRLVPNPGHLYTPGENLNLYFEVYGLSLDDGRSNYELTFAIYAAPEEPPPTWMRWARKVAEWAHVIGPNAPAISQAFDRTGIEYRTEEEMLVDIDLLDPGRYQLVVTVLDRHTGELTAANVVFEKVPGAAQARRGERD